MKTLKTDIEIGSDGSVKLLSPLPAWLKPGHAHVRMTGESVQEEQEHPKSTAQPDFLARQRALFGSRLLRGSQVILDEQRAERGSSSDLGAILAEVPDVLPIPGDEK